jgi:hypothetical protein
LLCSPEVFMMQREKQAYFMLSKTPKKWLQIDSVGQKLSTVWRTSHKVLERLALRETLRFPQLAVKGLSSNYG